jgi:signal peptidase I
MAFDLFKKKTDQKDQPQKKKSILREWLDAAVFAVVVATIIRTFFVEAYTIPTPSMEGSLLVNDFLFVSKMHYGARVPNTPLSVPFVHNTLPLSDAKSYSTAVQWLYKRLPGFGEVERNDDVVFNWPADMSDEGNRPVDKKENYIKRCVGIPGDKLQIKNSVLYINDAVAKTPKFLQHRYITATPIAEELADAIEKMHIEAGQENITPNQTVTLLYTNSTNVALLNQKYNAGIYKDSSYKPGMVETNNMVQPIWPISSTRRNKDALFFPWNKDNFGPFVIPKKGVTVPINDSNIALYYDIIKKYEGHKLDQDANGGFIMDGKPLTSYTFKMDYFWLMGDNRDNSLDSRYWGFVPEDHVVGKAWFVWLSYQSGEGLRFRRMFRSVKALED